jgi:hypothetical protein
MARWSTASISMFVPERAALDAEKIELSVCIHRKIGMSERGPIYNQLLRETALESIQSVVSGCSELMRGLISSRRKEANPGAYGAPTLESTLGSEAQIDRLRASKPIFVRASASYGHRASTIRTRRAAPRCRPDRTPIP